MDVDGRIILKCWELVKLAQQCPVTVLHVMVMDRHLSLQRAHGPTSSRQILNRGFS